MHGTSARTAEPPQLEAPVAVVKEAGFARRSTPAKAPSPTRHHSSDFSSGDRRITTSGSGPAAAAKIKFIMLSSLLRSSSTDVHDPQIPLRRPTVARPRTMTCAVTAMRGHNLVEEGPATPRTPSNSTPQDFAFSWFWKAFEGFVIRPAPAHDTSAYLQE